MVEEEVTVRCENPLYTECSECGRMVRVLKKDFSSREVMVYAAHASSASRRIVCVNSESLLPPGRKVHSLSDLTRRTLVLSQVIRDLIQEVDEKGCVETGGIRRQISVLTRSLNDLHRILGRWDRRNSR